MGAGPRGGSPVAQGSPQGAQGKPVALVVGAKVLELREDELLTPPAHGITDGTANDDWRVFEEVEGAPLVSDEARGGLYRPVEAPG